MESVESSVKFIPYAQEAVYAKLSDLNNAKDLINELPKETFEKDGVSIDKDSIIIDKDYITVPVSQLNLSFRVVNREPTKSIKYEVAGIPVEANLWIQILPVSNMESKIKVTLHYDIRFYLKPIFKGKLDKIDEGIERFAQMLASVPY